MGETREYIVYPSVSELEAEAKYRAAARRRAMETATLGEPVTKLPKRPRVTGDPEAVAMVGSHLTRLRGWHLSLRAGECFDIATWATRRGDTVVITGKVRRG